MNVDKIGIRLDFDIMSFDEDFVAVCKYYSDCDLMLINNCLIYSRLE